MKTIFRYTNAALLFAVIFALGVISLTAQDATPTPTAPVSSTCNAEADRLEYTAFTEKYKDKTLAGRKSWLPMGEAYYAKYKDCEASKTNIDWFALNIPKWKATIKEMETIADQDALALRFDNAVKAKNWDETYTAGKELVAKYPAAFRPLEIVLGMIGYDEAFKGNNKYNDDSLKYARMSIADLEAGREFTVLVAGKPTPSFGYGVYTYKNKEDALGWLNLSIGYITQIGQKNPVAAAPFLYKATQGSSTSVKQPKPFELIGEYYFSELIKLDDQRVKLLAEYNALPNTDAAGIAAKQQELDANAAMSKGYAERTMDSFSRAHNLSVAPAYKALMKEKILSAYKVRFDNKTEGVDAWMAAAITKPFINPTTPVAPITDGSPAVTTTAAGTTAAPAMSPTSPTTAKPAATTPAKPAPAVQPAVVEPVKPAATPKPRASVKKPVAKKKRA